MTEIEPDAYQCGACGFTRQSSRGVKSHIGHLKGRHEGYRDYTHSEDTEAVPLYREQVQTVWSADCPYCEETIQDRQIFKKHVKNCKRQPVKKASRQIDIE